MCLDNLKINQISYYNLPNSAFEADFLWKVSLKILNSGLILTTFAHDITVINVIGYDSQKHEHFLFFRHAG